MVFEVGLEKSPNIYVLILNWNGWKDTIECLESVFRLDYGNYRVIVCDNNSSDGSLEYIKAWAEGRLDVFVPLNNPLRYLSHPPVMKAIPYCFYNRNEAESGGRADDINCSLIFIQTGANLGFAGGNNVGLRYAMARNDFDYIWLLNNDTVADPQSLRVMIEKNKNYNSAGCKVGLIGSKLMSYYHPNIFQGLGGTYNKWFATTNHIGAFSKDNGQYDNEKLVDLIDYPVGASLFVINGFVHDVGLICEDYFLYFEELDWVLRGKARGWQIGYCWQAKIFHKEGASTGLCLNKTKYSEVAFYYGLKNRILFTKKFFPNFLFSVKFFLVLVLLSRIRRCQFNRIIPVLDAFRSKPLGHKYITK